MPCWCSQGKVAPAQVKDQQQEKLFSPTIEDPRVDGWWMDASGGAAPCTSEGRSGTDQFWQQKAPVLGVDMVVSSGLVNSGDNLFWNPAF